MSDKIIVKGKFISAENKKLKTFKKWEDDNTEATIELSPPTPSEISNLKAGDEVLVKKKVSYFLAGGNIVTTDAHDIYDPDDIIIILPQPQQEHSKQDENGNPIWEKPQQEFSHYCFEFNTACPFIKTEAVTCSQLRQYHPECVKYFEKKSQQEKCPKEAKPEKTFELEEILHRLLCRYKEGIISYTIKGESHWDKELEISCAVKEIKRWAEQSAKGELASEAEILKIIISSELFDHAMKDPNLKVGHIIGADKLAHALVGRIGKPEPKKDCQYTGCNKEANIGFYCWEHNPYVGMYDPKEEKKLREHYQPKPEIKELNYDKLDIMRIDPEKRRWVQQLQMTINTIREKLNEVINYPNP